ncbi:hypothetical protein J2S00_003744, partial [Caldalkalibacillus uzonensis]|nr:hypothetical protein [Caldalkalibacillus uzonensis]
DYVTLMRNPQFMNPLTNLRVKNLAHKYLTQTTFAKP